MPCILIFCFYAWIPNFTWYSLFVVFSANSTNGSGARSLFLYRYVVYRRYIMPSSQISKKPLSVLSHERWQRMTNDPLLGFIVFSRGSSSGNPTSGGITVWLSQNLMEWLSCLFCCVILGHLLISGKYRQHVAGCDVCRDFLSLCSPSTNCVSARWSCDHGLNIFIILNVS